VKYWEIIADRLSKAGWTWGCVSAVDSSRRTIWIVDAHRDGKRFIVRADEKLTAFVELEAVIRAPANCLDNLARFFHTRRRQTDPNQVGDLPRWVLRLFRIGVPKTNSAEERKKGTHESMDST
jgi:hypothetical protein